VHRLTAACIDDDLATGKSGLTDATTNAIKRFQTSTTMS
jgi:hypothetical protein